jgi:F0F1-type ATP synthase assembly protein I
MNLVLKVLLLSVLLSLAIKYLAPSLQIPLTDTHALIAILTPSLVMALLLVWRGQRSSHERDIN